MSLLSKLFFPGSITPVFQPIVSTVGSIHLHGLEALSRGPRGTHFESADVMFDYVRLKGVEPEVDRRCISLAVDAFRELEVETRLSFNVHAKTLACDAAFVPDFLGLLERHRIPAKSITLEIVEHSAPWLERELCAALERLRSASVSIALDDVGSGHSNFKMIVDTKPDYLKLDRYFVREMKHDLHRRAIVDCLVSLAARTCSRVVAEGVSDEEEMEALRSRGVDLLQGFHFARPAPVSELRSHPLVIDARSQLRGQHVR